jgi:hypothetical protein
VGEDFINGIALGGNSKTVRMLLAFKSFIQDYQKPQEKVLRDGLAPVLSKYEEFL